MEFNLKAAAKHIQYRDVPCFKVLRCRDPKNRRYESQPCSLRLSLDASKLLLYKEVKDTRSGVTYTSLQDLAQTKADCRKLSKASCNIEDIQQFRYGPYSNLFWELRPLMNLLTLS